jgi:uncharacterized protein
MDRNKILRLTEDFVKDNLKGYDSGHDWWHICRVRRLALYINEREKTTDPFIVEITALLHDTADSKFSTGDSSVGYSLIEEFMEKAGLAELKEQVIGVIKDISFSNKSIDRNLRDPLLQVIQDADRLDAIGAIGVARAFNYGGFRNNSIYDPEIRSDIQTNTTIGHFYQKLLKLRGLMNTATGKSLAEERHLFLEKFLDQFYREWDPNGEKSKRLLIQPFN